MASQNSFDALSELNVNGTAYQIYRLDAVTGEGAKRVAHVRFDSAGPKKLLIKLPNGTQSTAITPRPESPLLTTLAASSGAYKSRAIARAHITGAPIAAPWQARQTISMSMLAANALPTLATT